MEWMFWWMEWMFDGWMGWMNDGWIYWMVDGWMSWTKWWMDGLNGCLLDGLNEWIMDGWMGWINDGWIDWMVDGWMGWTKWWMDGLNCCLLDGLNGCLMDGLNDLCSHMTIGWGLILQEAVWIYRWVSSMINELLEGQGGRFIFDAWSTRTISRHFFNGRHFYANVVSISCKSLLMNLVVVVVLCSKSRWIWWSVFFVSLKILLNDDVMIVLSFWYCHVKCDGSI